MVETERATAWLASYGGKLIPARAAIVAYMMNDMVAKAEPFHCDLQGATDMWLSGEADEPTELVQ